VAVEPHSDMGCVPMETEHSRLVVMLWALMCESAWRCVSVVRVGWLEVWTDVEGVEVFVSLTVQ